MPCRIVQLQMQCSNRLYTANAAFRGGVALEHVPGQAFVGTHLLGLGSNVTPQLTALPQLPAPRGPSPPRQTGRAGVGRPGQGRSMGWDAGSIETGGSRCAAWPALWVGDPRS